MGVMLEKSRLADDLLDVVGHLAGGLRGGMALGIIGVGVLMGATTGIVGATVITLGLLTLPTLLKRGYDPGDRLRRDLRLGHARPDHPAVADPDPALRHPAALGRHALRGRGDARAAARRALLRLHRDPRHGPARRGAADPARGARRAVAARALDALRQGRGAAAGCWCSRCSARSSPASPRRPRPPRWARSARSWSTAFAGRMSWKVLRETCAVDHRDHRDGDVHPHLRAGLLARLPRPAAARS